MKKILLLSCFLVMGSFISQAQQDADAVATGTNTKTVTKKVSDKSAVVVETKALTKDEMATGSDENTPSDIKKILAEREARAAKIRADKKEENKNRIKQADSKKKTGVTKTKARVVTQEMLDAEKAEKAKKATKKDN